MRSAFHRWHKEWKEDALAGEKELIQVAVYPRCAEDETLAQTLAHFVSWYVNRSPEGRPIREELLRLSEVQAAERVQELLYGKED